MYPRVRVVWNMCVPQGEGGISGFTFVNFVLSAASVAANLGKRHHMMCRDSVTRNVCNKLRPKMFHILKSVRTFPRVKNRHGVTDA